jgi:hypothetical protein
MSRCTACLNRVGERPWRKRDEAFEERQEAREALPELWDEGWHAFLKVLESLRPEDLLKTVIIRSKSLKRQMP